MDRCIELANALANASLKKLNDEVFGIVLKDLPVFSYENYLNNVEKGLVNKKLSLFFVGFNNKEIDDLKNQLNCYKSDTDIYYSVEDAEISRNIGSDFEARVIIVKRETDKLSSLAWYDIIGVDEVYTEICDEALKIFTANTPIINFWKAIKSKDIKRIISLERLVDYYTYIKSCSESLLPDTMTNDLYRLGLCKDGSLFKNINVTAIKKAIIDNYQTILRLGALDKSDKKTIQTNAINLKADVVSNILEYYTSRNILILQYLELIDVQECLKSINKDKNSGKKTKKENKDNKDDNSSEGGSSTSKGGLKIKNSDSLGISLILDNSEEEIQKLISEIDVQLKDEESDKKANFQVNSGYYSISVKKEPSIYNLIEKFSGDKVFGGIIRKDAKNPIDVLVDLDKYDYTCFGNEYYDELLQLIEKFDSCLGNNIFSVFNSFVSIRAILAKEVDKLAYCPIFKIAESQDFTKLCIQYINTYENIISIFNEYYGRMMDLSTKKTKFVISSFLAMDMVYIIGQEKLHAIPTPLNPLYLWKYIELTREAKETSSSLEDIDKEFIVRKSNEIPDPVSAIMITNIVSGDDYSLVPYVGKVGNLPLYSSEQQINQINDGISDIENNIKKYMQLFPHSRFGFRVAVINPPNSASIVNLMKNILKDKDVELKGVDLQILRTKEADKGWGTIDDSDFDENIFNRFELTESTNFRIRVNDQRLESKDLIHQLSSFYHCIVFMDPNERTIKRVKNNNLLKIHPLCIPRVFEYDQFDNTVDIVPASEGGLFTDYSKLIEKLNDKPQNYHNSIWIESPIKKEEYKQILERTDWLIIADQNLKNLELDVTLNTEKIYFKTSAYREIGIYTRNSDKFIKGIDHLIRKTGNYVPTPLGIKKAISNIQMLNERGILSLVSKSITKELDENHAKGAIGVAVAAEWYKTNTNNSILASLDTELAKNWLEEREEGYIPDLIGIQINDDIVNIDIIEVKTHEGDFTINNQLNTIDGKAIEQLRAVYKIVDEIFNVRSRITTVSRREILRLQVFQVFYQMSIPNNIKYDFTAKLNKLFAGELKCRLNKYLYYVDLNTNGNTEVKHFDVHERLEFVHIKRPFIASILEGKISSTESNINLTEKQSMNDSISNGFDKKTETIPTNDEAVNRNAVETLSGREKILVEEYSDKDETNANNEKESPAQRTTVALNVEESSKLLYKVLLDYKIDAMPIDSQRVQVAARFIRYRVQLRSGETLQKVRKYKDDIMREIEATGDLLIDNELGSRYIYVDVPRANYEIIKTLDVLSELPEVREIGYLNVIIGQKPDGEIFVLDIAKAPHLLVAGQTGSGKTVFLYNILVSLLHQYSSEELEMVIVDPKRSAFIFFDRIPHLRGGKVIFDSQSAIEVLKELYEKDLEERTNLLAASRCLNLFSYNMKNPDNPMKPIIVIIDEYADLLQTAEMNGSRKSFEAQMMRLAQKARYVGIHLVLATQRPSANIVTSDLKTNLTYRISFKLPAHQDSMTILDCSGAEDLLANGDMLLSNNGELTRLQAPYIDEHDLESFIDKLL